MRLQRLFPLVTLLLLSGAAAGPRTLVVCAPGYPGDTGEAQPTMDAFARAAEKAAKWKKESLSAFYYPTEAEGESRLRKPDATLALLTAPFFYKYREELHLEPRLEVASGSGPGETWSLVAKRGAITSPASLAGFEITGIPGFAPGFVRGPILGAWGAVPDTVRITFSSRVPSALLRAASGEKIAVLLDKEQADALPGHPRSADLEVVMTSRSLPSSLLVTVAGRGGKDVLALVSALPRLQESEEGKDVLDVMHVSRFVPVDAARLEAVLGASTRTSSAPK